MSRTLATVRLYGSILWQVVAVLWDAVRETLPTTTEEAAPFISGMTWMFLIQMVLLVVTSWLWLQSVGR